MPPPHTKSSIVDISPSSWLAIPRNDDPFLHPLAMALPLTLALTSGATPCGSLLPRSSVLPLQAARYTLPNQIEGNPARGPRPHQAGAKSPEPTTAATLFAGAHPACPGRGTKTRAKAVRTSRCQVLAAITRPFIFAATQASNFD